MRPLIDARAIRGFGGGKLPSLEPGKIPQFGSFFAHSACSVHPRAVPIRSACEQRRIPYTICLLADRNQSPSECGETSSEATDINADRSFWRFSWGLRSCEDSSM